MLQDEATTNRNYERFIERVLDSGKIWGLLHPEGGWAICPSNEYDDRDVFVFWSDKAYASSHVKDGWSDYTPESIDLVSFIDNWLRGMHEDGFLVGPNWDANLCGKEVEPIEIAQKLRGS